MHHSTADNCLYGNNNGRFFHHRWLPPDAGFVLGYKPVLVPTLLATSKAINAEAAPMFWGQPFYVADLATMHTFLYRLGPASLALMREVTIISWPQGQKNLSGPVFNLLRGATSLERLAVYDVIIKRHPYRIPRGIGGDQDRARHVAKKLYRELFPWLETMIKAGGIEHVEKVLQLHEDNLKADFHLGFPNPTPGGAQWTQERRKQCEQAMFREILRIMEFDH